QVLDRIFADADLDFLVVTSSLTAVLGEVGQVDYCSANAFLDAFVRTARRAGKRALSINWDTWRDVGMAGNTAVPRELQALRATSLSQGIASHEGVAALDRILASDLGQVLVSPRDLHRRLTDRRPPQLTPAPATHERPALATAYAPPRSEVEETLARVWSSVL